MHLHMQDHFLSGAPTLYSKQIMLVVIMCHARSSAFYFLAPWYGVNIYDPEQLNTTYPHRGHLYL